MNHNKNYKEALTAGHNTQQLQKVERINIYNRNPNRCSNCNKILDYDHRKNKYCSRNCSASINNKNRNRHKTKISNCKNCNKRLTKSITLYCSHKCVSEYKLEQAVKNNTASKRTLKRYLIRKDNSCNCCKLTTWQDKPIGLEIHHIDGNSKNNKLENVKLVCPNCHSQTDTFKNKKRK